MRRGARPSMASFRNRSFTTRSECSDVSMVSRPSNDVFARACHLKQPRGLGKKARARDVTECNANIGSVCRGRCESQARCVLRHDAMGNAGSSGSDLAGLELRVAEDWPHDATQLSATLALV